MTAAPESRSAAAVLPLCYAGMLALAIGATLTPVFLTSLGQEFGGERGLTHEQLGRIGATLFSGVVAALTLTGSIADRLGPRLFAVGGNLLLAAGLLQLGVAPTYGRALLAALTMGLGVGTLDMVLNSLVAASRPESRATALSRLHASFGFGVVLNVMVATWALRYGPGWRAAALGLAAVPALVALGFARIRLPALVDPSRARHPLRELARHPHFRLALLIMLTCGAGGAGLGQWLPAFAEQGLHLPRAAGGPALMAMALSMAIGRMVAARWTRHRHPRPAMIAGALTSAALVATGAAVPSPWIALPALALAGFTAGIMWPGMLALTANRFPGGGGSMFGWLAAAGNTGGTLMPWTVGIISDAAGLHIAMGAVALPFVVYAALLAAGPIGRAAR